MSYIVPAAIALLIVLPPWLLGRLVVTTLRYRRALVWLTSNGNLNTTTPQYRAAYNALHPTTPLRPPIGEEGFKR